MCVSSDGVLLCVTDHRYCTIQKWGRENQRIGSYGEIYGGYPAWGKDRAESPETTGYSKTRSPSSVFTNTYEHKLGNVEVTKVFSGVKGLPDRFQITNTYNGDVFTLKTQAEQEQQMIHIDGQSKMYRIRQRLSLPRAIMMWQVTMWRLMDRQQQMLKLEL